MCSTANFVLPLRRTCEAVAAPGRLCGGVSMTTMLPGLRSHGAPQDTDMDVAWQELMAITELQEFEATSGGSYETAQYQTMEPMAPVGEYGTASSLPHRPPASCELSSANIYGGSYSEGVSTNNKDLMYGHTEPQHVQKMLHTSSHSQPTVMALRDYMDMSDATQEHRRANICLSQVVDRNLRWTTQGLTGKPGHTDDIESDSGLSLDSNPPLASPDNPACGALNYQSRDISLAYSDGEPDSVISKTREVHTLYPIGCQSQTTEYLQTGPHLPCVSSQPGVSHFQGHTPRPCSVTTQSQTSALCNMYSEAAMTSRQKIPLKQQQSISTTASLSRDERRALALKIPFPMEKIVNLPVDDFNELLTQYTLTDTQMALVRDIRRRGKNKVAAQNCRKRKLESIIHLERELNQLKAQRENLVQERLEFQHSLTFIKCCLADLYAEVFTQLRDENGQSYSMDEHFLQQTPDGQFYLVPHTMQ
ncbi:transcription factor NF-E2 45 kDa subunit [Gouania willdenowi]|uniref:BZIP domain-containing protein n=1 Tax=Gouania willdenowi TaxID=441366 RepID=A0A8C5DCC3_GOUWI|nr:transcription factor NF-E2 45 kDa subunit [Gouania willdenowi]